MMLTPKELTNFIKTEDPRLWKVCYPRIYDEPQCGGRFYSPKLVALQMYNAAAKYADGAIGSSEDVEFVACSHLAQYRVPIFWLPPDIMTAIKRTTPPQAVEWYDMRMPFDACVFMIPKGTFTHPTNGDVAFIVYSRFKAGTRRDSPLIPGFEYGSVNGGMTFLALTMGPSGTGSGGYFLHWTLPLDVFGPTIKIPDLDTYVDLFKEHRHYSGVAFASPYMSLEDNQLMAQVGHYVFGAMLLMQARPEMLTRERLMKKVVKKGVAREFWSPNVLGKSYKVKGEPLGGTHASPRLHWVRGHYKDQVFGTKRNQKKLLWIEPYVRGD